jgi:PEP-CTERM motif-containing protein
MVRTLTAVLVVVALCSVASAEIIYDFEGSSPPTGVTYYGNAGVASSFGSGTITAPEGSSLFGASTGQGTSPFGTPVTVNGVNPPTFITGNPAGGTPSGGGTGGLVEFSGLSFDVTLSVSGYVTALMTIATSEANARGFEDVIQIWVEDTSGEELAQGFVIDPIGGTTYNEDYVGIPSSAFSGTSFSDTALGTFTDGEMVSGFFQVGGKLPGGSYTIYVVVADFDDGTSDTAFFLDSIDATIPEPGTWLLFGFGALGLVGYRRFRKVRK